MLFQANTLSDEILMPTRPVGGTTRLAASGGFLLGDGPVNIGSKVFNSLPPDIRALPSLASFKKALRKNILVCEIDDNVLEYLSSLS